MSLKVYEDIKEMLCDELEKASQKGKIGSANELEIIDKLTHSLKSVETLIAMEEYGDEEGYSERGYSMRGGSYARDGRRGNRGGSYRGGEYDDGSYARDGRGRGRNARRDSMGRYSRDGYSRHDGKEDMVEQLRDMMEDAPDDQTRMKIQRLMQEMEKA